LKAFKLLRILAALALLGWLINRVGHTDLLERLRDARVELLLLALVSIVLDGLLRAFNWRQLILAMRLAPRVPYGRLLACFLSSAFLGQVVPSTAGTDALRVLSAARTIGGSLGAHAAAIVLLNAISLFAGCLIGLACLPFLGLAQEDATGLRPAVALLFCAAVLGAVSVYLIVKYQRGFALRLLRKLRGRRGFKIRRGLRRFMGNLLVFDRYATRALPVFGVACLTLLTRSTAFAFAGAAVHLQLPVLAWLTLTPSIMLSGLVPYSVAGYGGDQAASVYFLTGFGALPAKALALGLLMPLVPMFFNLLGAIPVLLGKVERNPDDHREGSSS
jgi:uncharacterized membrane protein YbhN (UPF0104 family)